MSEAEMNREDFDPALFSPEELAMMQEADGVVEDVRVQHDAAELQRQFNCVARLVAEGGERERQLRALIFDLTAMAPTTRLQQSAHEQTQNLAMIVMASSERELQLQQCLETLRGVVINRAKDVL